MTSERDVTMGARVDAEADESDTESVLNFITDENEQIDAALEDRLFSHRRLRDLLNLIDVRSTVMSYSCVTVLEVFESYYRGDLSNGHARASLEEHLQEINSGHYLFRWDVEMSAWFWMSAYRIEYIFTKSTRRVGRRWITKLWVFIKNGTTATSHGKSPVILMIKPEFFEGGATTQDMKLLANGAHTPKDFLENLASAFPWYAGLQKLCVRPGYCCRVGVPFLEPGFDECNLNVSWALLYKILREFRPGCNMPVVSIVAEWWH